MKVKVLFFSLLRDISESDEIDFPIPSEDLSVGDVMKLLFAKYEGLRQWDEKLLIAVNCEYASRTDAVKPGDEIAIMPPVQGG